MKFLLKNSWSLQSAHFDNFDFTNILKIVAKNRNSIKKDIIKKDMKPLHSMITISD